MFPKSSTFSGGGNMNKGKIKWCLKQKKGISLIELKPHLSEAYVKEADETLENVFATTGKWKVITAYYACYNSVYALLMKAGINCEINDIDQLIDAGIKILEPSITDVLLPGLQKELLLVGQSKGKFGGGSRRIFKQTQKKTPEGNNPSFACFAVVGNEDGYVGGGSGKSKDTVPAREKATRNAKLNVFKIRRGCGSWECGCKTPHSIPFAVEGKCGSVRIKLMPAPKGKGLCIEPECAKILKLAGIKDIWCKTFGQTRVKVNLVKACIDALKQLMTVKVHPNRYAALGIAEGRSTETVKEEIKNE